LPFADDNLRDWRRTYIWMAARLSRHLGHRVRSAPIWLWVRDKPDMRRNAHGNPVVRIELEIPRDRLLVSDFINWHGPLNTSWARGAAFKREKADWERILYPRMQRGCSYQGVVEEVRLDWFRAASHHVARRLPGEKRTRSLADRL
jgi:hypothetical protein